jgi:hypothetical protein
MPVRFKVCIDCADPHRLAAFWADALEYVIEDNSALISYLLDNGQITSDDLTTVDGRRTWRTAAAVRDPGAPFDPRSGVGQGNRLLFQVVPETKTVKNRVHLDLHVGVDRRAEVVERLVKAGGRVLYQGEGGGSTWVTMADPEGNEFDVV